MNVFTLTNFANDENLKIGHIRYIDFPYFFEALNYKWVFLSRNVVKSVTIVFEKEMIDIDRIEIIFFWHIRFDRDQKIKR